MARYEQAFKDKAVGRVLQPETTAVEVVARQVEVATVTLEWWREDARASR